MIRGLGGLLSVLGLVTAALAALAINAGASHQAPKDGCTSTATVQGTLVSEAFTLGELPQPAVHFDTWWEIESESPEDHDLMLVELHDAENPAAEPLVIAKLNPQDAAGSPETPHSSAGFNEPPAWLPNQTFPLTAAPGTYRLVFRFNSVDPLYQGFRGWAIDDVGVTAGLGGDTVPLLQTRNFEAGLPPGWSTSGFWRIQASPESIHVLNPAINPNLVTLPDAEGQLLADSDSGHQRVAWFGEPATGTYCGADFNAEPQPPPPPPPPPPPSTPLQTAPPPASNTPPAASFTVSPASAKTGDQVTFDGSSSSDPEGPIASYSWDFGDGSPAAPGATATHVYERAGSYTVLLTVTDGAGATSVATHGIRVASNLPRGIEVADSLNALSNPKPLREANVEPDAEDGPVFVQLPRRRRGQAGAAQAPGAPKGFIPLTQAAQLPLGSIVDTGSGKVRLESAVSSRRGSRRTQRAEFFDGRFQMRQARDRSRRGRRGRRLITEMVLKGGTFRGCPSTKRRARRSAGTEADDSARRRRRSRRRSSRSRVRRLWGRGRGRFRTRGRYSASTVRGTTWLVEDRCGGTLTRLPRRPRTSVVDVRDSVRRRTIRLRAGRSYLARPRISRRR